MTHWSRRDLLGAGLALGLTGSERAAATLPPLASLPPVVDFSALFGPVKAQGDRFTCAYFSTTALIEAELARLTGAWRPLSEQYLTDWAHADQRPPADESTSIPAVLSLAYKHGMVPASVLPYRSKLPLDRPLAPPTAEILSHRIRLDFDPLMVKGFSWTLRHLSQRPLIVALPSANNWAGWRDSDGLFEPVEDYVPGKGTTLHFVVFTGYDMRTQFFVFRSSWGPSWGRGGYGRVSFDSMRTRLARASGYFFERIAMI
jgi:hypothetical protein